MTREYPASATRTRRRRLFAAAAVVGALLVASVAAMADDFGDVVAPPVPGGVSLQESSGGSEKQYLSVLGPHLEIVIGEGNRLAELGQSRSRNLIELSLRMDRFREASANLLQFVESKAPPSALESFVSSLSALLELADIAIDESIESIREFDWSALELTVEQFADAIKAIEGLSEKYFM